MARIVFVTVGSTRFDRLVAAASSPSFLHLVHQLGYSHLTLQHGNSPIPPHTLTTPSEHAHLTPYSYKPSLHEDMENADLVISHAGSGSILEALRLKKKLIVVVNEDLMDNHQQELGSALHEQKHLVCTSVSGLEETLKAKEYDSLIPFPEPDPTRFANFLDARLSA
ncbi:N-acetylglucosaminyldiphosphodolichol N-acetylglucosaminyltransferase catalytic subunit alg13 [Mortierella alpina]|uniref:UDP-N-acetylglucosamine transferase subunit ALG13 n=1 Tax=Mortierella alpina TaxID=64518 RepID=A0A9P6IVW8_MORAP|nr:N-acetylglucosaminyldiphosphodolichol N-acetylglucosaminyltransferase catalytic subunit alg13 [Mortierella alpina]